jgi:DNA-binding LytR/AlgR family response regulator
MSTALIADDEPQLARFLGQQLALLWPELQLIAVARNGREAAQQIEALQPDIAFLDIRMPGLSGLEVAQGIEGPTRVVFVTAFDEFAVQAFEQAAVDYLLKPVSSERLRRTIARLQTSADAGPDDSRLAGVLQRLLPAAGLNPTLQPPLRWIRASAGDTTHQIPVDEVLFFQADDKYTCVHSVGREHLIRTPIAELAARLDSSQFWQVHRSTLVNLQHLQSTRRDEASRLWLRLRGHPVELPVSRAFVHLFKAM